MRDYIVGFLALLSLHALADDWVTFEYDGEKDITYSTAFIDKGGIFSTHYEAWLKVDYPDPDNKPNCLNSTGLASAYCAQAIANRPKELVYRVVIECDNKIVTAALSSARNAAGGVSGVGDFTVGRHPGTIGYKLAEYYCD
ncbi:MAG: hypothetical protein KAI85_03450 [Halopseudomonas aestusnigri]|jgi:hypothetical protein|nr:hypothetical protein [Halopseudomonas aestusnigri]